MIGFLLLVQSTTQKNNQKTQKKMIKSIDSKTKKVYNIIIKKESDNTVERYKNGKSNSYASKCNLAYT